MWIDRETRTAPCRYCGRAIIWATRPDGRAVAFDRPLVLAPALLTKADQQVVDVDRTKTTLHVQTCAAFQPPLEQGHR
jgi:hypothetical protein